MARVEVRNTAFAVYRFLEWYFPEFQLARASLCSQIELRLQSGNFEIDENVPRSSQSLSFGHMQCVTDKVINVLATLQDAASGGSLRKLRLDYCRSLTTNCLASVAAMVKLHQLSIRSERQNFPFPVVHRLLMCNIRILD